MTITVLNVLSGCALLNYKNTAELPLIQPTGPSQHAVLQMTYERGNLQQTLLCVLELDESHIALAGLTNEGLSLFNLNYDGKTVKIDRTPFLSDTIDPQTLLADLQFTYFPIETIQHFLPQGWRVVNSENHRIVYFENQKIADIRFILKQTKWPEASQLNNFQSEYQLQIKTISHNLQSDIK